MFGLLEQMFLQFMTTERYFPFYNVTYSLVPIMEEGLRQKRRQRSALLVEGKELIQFHATLAICIQDDLKKRMNKWRYGCFEKMFDHLVRFGSQFTPY